MKEILELGKVYTIGAESVRVLRRNNEKKISKASGLVVPTNGTPGYALDCEFTQTDGGVKTTRYINEGSATSCDFNPVLTGGQNNLVSADLDTTLIQYATVSITNAEMLALRATPKTLVAAPGAGKILEFVSAILIFDYTGAYTESTDNLAVRYENGSGAKASDDIEAGGFLDATADTMTTAVMKKDTIVAKTVCENKALVLHNIGDGELGGGNAANAIRVKVAYRVHTSGW